MLSAVIYNFILSLIFINFMGFINTIDFQLKHVFVLFRHGDRSPITYFKHVEGFRAEDWPIGPGQLTQKGIDQEFELGSFLSERYDNLISHHYDRNEIWVRSSDYERTLMSAESVLAGLYFRDRISYPKSDKIHPSLNWLPIPIHTKLQDRDSLLLTRKCPYHKLLWKNISLDYDAKMSSEDKEMLMDLMQKMRYEMQNQLRFATRVRDTLHCGMQHGKRLPSYVTPKIYQRLDYFNDLSYYLHYNSQQKEKMHRMMSGTLLGDIINKTRQVLHHSENMLGRNMTIYSAHDTDVAFLLSILGAFNFKQPPYCASVLIEIGCDEQFCDNDEIRPENWYVRLFYRNDTNEEPYPLAFSRCPGICNLRDFLSGYASLATTADERYKLCHENLSDFVGLNSAVIWIVIVLAVFCVILLIAVGICFCYKSATRKRESANYSLLYDYEM